MKIFISSPKKGFENIRTIAIEAIQRFEDGKPIAMEYFSASDPPPIEECKRRAGESDGLILLLVGKYGDARQGISVSEQEFLQAEHNGKPCFVFPIIPEGKEHWEPEDENEETREKHLRLYNVARDKHYCKAVHLNDLASAITQAIRNYEYVHGLLGRKSRSFLSFDEYFQSINASHNLLTVDQPCLERTNDEFYNFIADEKKTIGLLYGRGGIGKTKQIYELGKTFSERCPSWDIRFFKAAPSIDNELLSELGQRKTLIIIDDADRYDHLKELLALLDDPRYTEKTKFILTARLTGKNIIEDVLSRQSPESLKEFNTLQSLTPKGVLSLATFCLGDKSKNQLLLEKLVAVSEDCPLITVVGGKLIAKGILDGDPALLASETDFKRLVFLRLKDEYTSRLPHYSVDSQRWDALINLLSALSPIYPINTKLVERASKYIGIEVWNFRLRISLLEEFGLLYRAGRRVRLIPDMLADHILEQICLTASGQPSGYADEVFNVFWDVHLSALLRNLAELDWRARQDDPSSTLLDNVWNTLLEKFGNASNPERVEFLKHLQDFAVYQPKRILKLCHWAINNPGKKEFSDDIPIEYRKMLAGVKHETVVAEVAPLLGRVAYHIDYLPVATKLLWELGKNDRRETNPNPYHPIRILKNLADYIYYTTGFQKSFLDSVKSWLTDQEDVYGHQYSIVPVLAPILSERSLEIQRSDGFQLIMSWQPLKYSAVKNVRVDALQLMEKIFYEGPPREKGQVIALFTALLRNPRRGFPLELIPEWVPEQLQVLNFLKQFLKDNDSIVLRLAVYDNLEWPSFHAYDPVVKSSCQAIRASITKDTDFQIASNLTKWNFSRSLDETFEQTRNRAAKEASTTVSNLLNSLKLEEVVNKLIFIVEELQQWGQGFGEGLVFINLAEKSVEAGKIYAEKIFQQPNLVASIYLHVVLTGIREKDPAWVSNYIKKCLKSKETLKGNIAFGYARGGWISEVSKITESDWHNLEKLAEDKDERVLQKVLEALENLIKFSDPVISRKAIIIANKIELTSATAEFFARMFDPSSGVDLKTLQSSDVKMILDKFFHVDDLDKSYSFMSFLIGLFSTASLTVLDFFFERIDYAMSQSIQKRASFFHAVPYRFFDEFEIRIRKIANTINWGEILDAFVKNSVKHVDSHTHAMWLSQLFDLFVVDFDWVHDDLIKRIEATETEHEFCALLNFLQSRSPDFVLREHWLVSKFFVLSEKFKRQDYVNSILSSVAVRGVRTGSPGQPSPELTRKKEIAKQLADEYKAKNFPVVSQFYQRLAQNAEAEIKEMLDRDAELFDDAS